MKAHRRLRGLLRASTYRRAWRSVERSTAKRRLLRRVEIRGVEELKGRYFPGTSKVPNEAPWKYLDLERALDINLRRAQHLGLLRKCRPQGSRSVLDLGCGSGLFLFICKTCGYDCLGLDVGDVPLYDDFAKILGIERVEARIETLRRLPRLRRSFDYITAFGTVFNRNERGWWKEREWDYFLEDVHQLLAPGGRLFIEPNPMGSADVERWMSRYTPEVLRAFTRRGARVDRHGALFPREGPEETLAGVLWAHSEERRRPGPASISGPSVAHEVGERGPVRPSGLPGPRSRAASWSRWRGLGGDRCDLRTRSPRPRGLRLALSLVGLLIGVLAAEAGLRSFKPQEVRLRWYSREGIMVLVPGFRGTYHQLDFSSHVETDSDGLRDREYAPGKPVGTFRILVLGDSLTAGLQVPLEETYPKRLESLLAVLHPTGRMEVVNAGIPGYGTADELRYLEAFGSRWKPDLVLLAFFSGNDLQNNLMESGIVYAGERVQVGRRPLTEWQYRIKGLRSWISARSHLYQYMRERLRFKRDDDPGSLPLHLRELTAGAGSDRETVCSMAGADSDKGWRLTLDLLRRIDEVSQGLGAKLALATIPAPWQNAPSLFQNRVDQSDLAQEACDPLLPGRMICEFASSIGVSCMDLLPEFWASGPERLDYWRGGRHLTAAGHEKTARLLATFLRKDRLVPPPRRG